MSYTTHYDSPLGGITLASDGKALTGLWFEGQRHFGSTLGGVASPAELPFFDDTRRWLDIYFSGRPPGFTPPLALHGTPFQQRVWDSLCAIPYGETITYGELARRLGVGSAQAVGGAVGHNPIALVVPCHRVVGSGGALTGYAAGLDRKQALLQLEQKNYFAS